jgi:hypothetical protein
MAQSFRNRVALSGYVAPEVKNYFRRGGRKLRTDLAKNFGHARTGTIR